MLVLFLSFIFSRIAVKCQSQHDNNTQLITQLQKSLSKVNTAFAENNSGKKEHVRKSLKRSDDYNEETDFLDYTVPTLWWHTKAPPTTSTTTVKTTTTTTTTEASTTKSTPTNVRALTTSYITYKFSHTITEPTISLSDNPTVIELQDIMEQDRCGYGTAFFIKFLELTAIKPYAHVTDILGAIEYQIKGWTDPGEAPDVSTPFQDTILHIFNDVKRISAHLTQRQAAVGHYMLKNKAVLCHEEVNQFFDMYDNLFNKAEGEQLFASLGSFKNYPDGKTSALDVSKGIVDALLEPLKRMYNAADHKELVALMNKRGY